MTDATFGDFWDKAAGHLEAAVSAPPARPASPATLRSLCIALHRVILASSRFLDDQFYGRAGEAAGVTWEKTIPRLGEWGLAVAHMRKKLTAVEELLRDGYQGGNELHAQEGSVAWNLNEAAGAITMARDVLQTHFRADPDGQRVGISDWAAAIISEPASHALLVTLADHLRAASTAIATVPISPTAPRNTVTRWRRIQAASRQLSFLNTQVGFARKRYPVLDRDAALLRAIPVNTVPERRLPAATDQAPDLCAGAIATATRVRALIRDLPDQAAKDPGLNAVTMRHTATACTVITHNCHLILQTLAEFNWGHLNRALEAAADDAAASRHAWLAAARAWDGIMTDSEGSLTETTQEIEDLSLWTGKVAYADLSWTPARGPAGQPRPAAALITGPQSLANTIGAVHSATFAVSRIASVNQRQIAVAQEVRRLYVHTRTLPEEYNVPRPIAPAPPDRGFSLLQTYLDVGVASHHTAQQAAGLALATGAPTSRLAEAMNAVDEGKRGQVPEELLADKLRTAGVSSREMLARAAKLDRARIKLLGDAGLHYASPPLLVGPGYHSGPPSPGAATSHLVRRATPGRDLELE